VVQLITARGRIVRIFFLIVPILIGCQDYIEYNPWQSKAKYKDLTRKNIERLQPSKIPGKVRVALLGDPQAVPGHLENAVGRINQYNDIDFVLILGDITDRGLLREWNWVGDILKKFKEPVLTVVGNHDGLNKGSKIYQDMFGPLDYTFTYEGIKFILWNNNKLEWPDLNFRYLYAEHDTDLPVVLAAHQPPESGTLNDSDEYIWQDIRNKGKQIASVHGHMHNFNYQKDNDVSIYTVDRVTGSHFGIMDIDLKTKQVSFQNCTPQCEVIND